MRVYLWPPHESETIAISLPEPAKKAVMPERADLLYICDESSQTADEYLAVAGLALPKKHVDEVLKRMDEIKTAFGKTGEVKWNRASSQGGALHKAYIDLVFDLIAENKLHFHIRFSKTADYDDKLSGDRRRTDTVSKAFYQLLLHRAVGLYCSRWIVDVICDGGDCTALLPGMIGALKTHERRRYNTKLDTCIRSIKQHSSSETPLLQLLDVVLGALTSYRNGRHLVAGANATKTSLALHAFERTGWPSIDGSCANGAREIVRWNARPTIKLKAVKVATG